MPSGRWLAFLLADRLSRAVEHQETTLDRHSDRRRNQPHAGRFAGGGRRRFRGVQPPEGTGDPAQAPLGSIGRLPNLYFPRLPQLAQPIDLVVECYSSDSEVAELVKRSCGAEQRERADRLLGRWGVVAIILSRPLPMLAETVAFTAGASARARPWRSALAAAGLGYLPAALV